MKLPNNWKILPLGDVVEFDKSTILPTSGKRYRYVSLDAIEQNSGKLLNSVEIDGSRIKSTKLKFDNRHILYSKLRPYLNKVILPDFEGICVTDLVPLLPKQIISREYLWFYLRSYIVLEYVNSKMAGIKMPRLRTNDFITMPIVVPPLHIQKFITTKLQSAFSKLEQAENDLDEAEEKLKKIMTSALYKLMVLDIQDNWNEQTVKEVSNNVQYGYTAKSSNKGDWKYLRITDIQNGLVDWANVPFVYIDSKQSPKYELKYGDILFARSGATAGKSYLFNDVAKSIFASYLIRVQVNENKIIPEYLYYFFQSSAYWKQVSDEIVGVAQPNVNGTKLSNIKLPVPPIEKQKEIITKIKQIDKIARQSLLTLKAAITYSKKIKQSLLQKAFNGELVN